MENSFQALKQRFNDQMAVLFQQDGFSPLVGRIFALLLFSPEPISLAKMAEELGVSKAAVSIQVRTLERSGMCVKLSKKNDRKDYYFIADQFSLNVLQIIMKRLESSLREVENALRLFPPKESIAKEDQASYDISKKRFMEMRLLYRICFESFANLEQEWQNRKNELHEN